MVKTSWLSKYAQMFLSTVLSLYAKDQFHYNIVKKNNTKFSVIVIVLE